MNLSQYEFPRQRTERLLTTVNRNFAVVLEGIWRHAVGTYVSPLKEPFKVKCSIDGNSMQFKQFHDLFLNNDKFCELKVIDLNLRTLPYTVRGTAPAFQGRGGFRRNGTPVVTTTILDFPVMDEPIVPDRRNVEEGWVPGAAYNG